MLQLQKKHVSEEPGLLGNVRLDRNSFHFPARWVDFKEMAAEESFFSRRKRETSLILLSTNEIFVVLIELCRSWLRTGGPSIGLVQRGFRCGSNLWRQPAGRAQLTLSSSLFSLLPPISGWFRQPRPQQTAAAGCDRRPAPMNLFCFSLVSGKVPWTCGCRCFALTLVWQDKEGWNHSERSGTETDIWEGAVIFFFHQLSG